MRLWSARNARWLSMLYGFVERTLTAMSPLFERIGYRRVEKPVYAVERLVKGALFDSKSCGLCTLGDTGMSCPMNCPKALRNGPCGGVRADGGCEVDPQMPCVWVVAWEGAQRIEGGVDRIQALQAPVDARMQGTSAWLREARRRRAERKPAPGPGPEGSHVL